MADRSGRTVTLPATSLLFLILLCSSAAVLAQPTRFFYLSDQRIVTVELIDNTNLILNYVNLGSSYEIFEATKVVLLDSEERHYRGQVYELEHSTDPSKKYAVTELIKPGEFKGYTVRGQFSLQSPPSRSLLQISSRILDLEPVSEKDFDLIATRVARIELGDPDRKQAIQRVGFDRGYGKMWFTGTEKSLEVEEYFPDEDLLAPVILANPPPRLPADYQAKSEPVQVRIRLSVSRVGGTSNFEVVDGIDPLLNQMAIETVRNSWIFLPAVSETQVVDTEIVLLVGFVRAE